MQATQHKTHIHLSCKHIQPHTLHHSYLYWLKIHERHTQSKGEDRSTALARSVVVTTTGGLNRFMYAQPRYYPLSSPFKTYSVHNINSKPYSTILQQI